MQLIHVAAVALNQTPLDWPGNASNIRSAIDLSREKGVSIVCLPELSITGYGCEDAFLSADVQRRAQQTLEEIIPNTKNLIVSVGLPVMHSGALYNCVAVIADRGLLGFVAKSHLAGDGIHYEPRWFKPWPRNYTGEVNIEGQSYPIGNIMFDFSGVRIGFEICEDAWAANRPGGALGLEAVDFILNPSGSHFAFGKQEVRRRLVLESSRAFGVTYVYANLLGNEAGRVIYDGSTLIASGGRMVIEGPRLSFEDMVVTTACVDVDVTRMNRARLSSFQPGIGDSRVQRVESQFEFPTVDPQPKTFQVATWETGPDVKEEEFSRAVALGLFDYLRKSRAGGF
ncbi:MAG: NAD+ synthetase, partial [Candidatus Omnitrophica bacterium]|nr:NAD+ synthetase [Candidatus Omnitrophota bacterium]